MSHEDFPTENPAGSGMHAPFEVVIHDDICTSGQSMIWLDARRNGRGPEPNRPYTVGDKSGLPILVAVCRFCDFCELRTRFRSGEFAPVNCQRDCHICALLRVHRSGQVTTSSVCVTCFSF